MSDSININLNNPLKGKALIVFDNDFNVTPFDQHLIYERPMTFWSTDNVVLLCENKGLVDVSVTNFLGGNRLSNLVLPIVKKKIKLHYPVSGFSNSFFLDQNSWDIFLNRLLFDYRSNYLVNQGLQPIDYQFNLQIGNSDSYSANNPNNLIDGTITLLQNSFLFSPFTLMHEMVHGLKILMHSDDHVDAHLDANNTLALMHNNAGLYIDYYTLLNMHGLKSLAEDHRDRLQYYYFPETNYNITSVYEYLEYLEYLGLNLCLVFQLFHSENDIASKVKKVDHVKLIKFLVEYKKSSKLRKRIKKGISGLITLKATSEYEYISNIGGLKINQKFDTIDKYKKEQVLIYLSKFDKNVDLFYTFFLKHYSGDKKITEMLKI